MKIENLIIVIFCLSIISMLYLIFLPKQNIQQNVNWNAYTTEKAVELPETPYNCKTLKAVIGRDLNYCVLSEKRPQEVNKAYVMGDYNSILNRIRVTQETRNSSRVHEFIHYAISCYLETKENELCTRSTQKMLEELNLI